MKLRLSVSTTSLQFERDFLSNISKAILCIWDIPCTGNVVAAINKQVVQYRCYLFLLNVVGFDQPGKEPSPKSCR